uniref:Uncharacterized protein n=1 Tax=Myoviridae sp. ctPuP5 TaxID=2823543 RepID=A0A8S5L9Q5_9CAUD|nr:MAG TPA: hypothetical protein [Myoviridae sp. ctPuP5]
MFPFRLHSVILFYVQNSHNFKFLIVSIISFSYATKIGILNLPCKLFELINLNRPKILSD